MHANSLFLSTLSLRRATSMLISLCCGCFDFYPRSPCGERHTVSMPNRPEEQFLSTLSLRRATQKLVKTDASKQFISIHALLAESDRVRQGDKFQQGHFYPRSPCGERRESQPPCARPTTNFYPRSPCGERQAADISARREARISIHALLAESDPPVRDIIQWEGIFLSTLSLRRAT